MTAFPSENRPDTAIRRLAAAPSSSSSPKRRKTPEMRKDGSSGLSVTIVAHDVDGIGGMEIQLVALITRLLSNGVKVEVLSRTLSLPHHPDLSWRRIRTPARPFSFAYPSFAVVASLRLLRRRTTLLHTTGAIIFNRADCCTVHYLHNRPGEITERSQYQSVFYRLNARIGRLMSQAFERRVYGSERRSRVLVAVSESLEEELCRTFPQRRRTTRRIRNGVDTDRFHPDKTRGNALRNELGLTSTTPIALFVGSEWRRKGLATVVSALTFAARWHLVVVGRGDARALMIAAEKLGVGNRIHLVGETTQPEHFYALADAFVLPSAYETFSLAAFEAAAAALPVVATAVGAIDEILSAGGGLRVEPHARSVANALLELEHERLGARAMGLKGMTVAQRFGWDSVAEMYLQLYDELRCSGSAAALGTVRR